MVEAPHEEVGEEVRRRLVLGAVDLVAVRAGELRVAGEVGAAVRVRDDDVVAVGGLLDRGADPLGAVVQLGRHRAHLEVPAAPRGDLLHVQRERAAADDDLRHAGKRELVDEQVVEVGAAGELDVLDLVEHRVRGGALGHRERGDLRALAGDVPGRDDARSGSFGTRPIFTALAALRYEPNEPPSSTCEISSGSMPRSRQRIVPAGRDRRLRELQLAHVALREEDVVAEIEDVLLADLPEALRRLEDEAAGVVEHPGADELGDRVDEARAAEPDRRDVADHRQLTSPSTIFTPSIAPSAARMPQRICAASNAGPGGRGGRERPRGRAEHDLGVRADVDEEPHAPVERDARSRGCRRRCRGRRTRRAPGT